MKKVPGKTFCQIFLRKIKKYLVILIIMTAIMIPILLQSYSLTRDIIIEQIHGQSEQALASFTNELKTSNRFVNSLLFEKDFSSLLLLDTEPSSKYYPLFTNLKQKIADSIAGLNFLDSAFIVFKDNPIFISNFFISDDFDNDYGEYFFYGDSSIEEFRDKLFNTESMHQRFFTEQGFFTHPIGEISAITYFLSTSQLPSTINSCFTGFVFNTQKIVEAFLSENTIRDGVLVLYNANEPIFSYNVPTDFTSVSDIKLKLKNDYIVLDQSSKGSNVRVVLGISNKTFNASSRKNFSLMVLFFILGCIVLLLLNLFYSYKETCQINDIIRITETSFKKNGYSNDYRYIRQAFNEIYSEKQHYILKIENLIEYVKTSTLEKIFILGVHSENEKKEVIHYFNNSFDFYSVIRFKLNSCTFSMILALKDEIDLLFKTPISVINSKEGEITTVVFFDTAEYYNLENVQQILHTLVSKNSLHIGVSDIFSCLENIHLAYKQAEYASQYENSPHMYAYSDNKKLFDMTVLMKIYNSILIGELATTEELIENIINFIQTQRLHDGEILQLYYSLRQSISNAYVEVMGDNEHKFEMPQISPLNDRVQDICALKDTAAKLCVIINSKKKSNNEELKKQIIDYIQKNYFCKGLNANLIATYFSLSEKYIFLLIKESTGTSLGKYIEGIRLIKAVEYLITTDLSNKEISEKVGFGSDITFYRSFSKKYAKTPSNFRKIHT